MPIRIFDGPDKLAQAAAELFVGRAALAMKAGGRLDVVLSGGSTPRRLFELLAEEPYCSRVDWEAVHFFWGDERTVPPDHPDSNFGAVNEALFSKLDLAEEQIHRIRAELADPDRAAAAYEAELRRHFGLSEGEVPRFDLVFLGMGADGHTASLFPGTAALEESERSAVAVWVEKLGTHRVTLTCPVFDNAACIVFLVTGQEKAETLRDVLEGAAEMPGYPVQLIRPRNGEVLWYIDKTAGRLLSRRRWDQ
ncbi:MAG: 6-phosphogluconolactonase [Gemmatimonadota bacterium]|nr:MAG: 6-phosphogluconolactonase [Gemmatimonadota bacterium]